MERCGSCQYIEGSFESYWGSVSMRNVVPMIKGNSMDVIKHFEYLGMQIDV